MTSVTMTVRGLCVVLAALVNIGQSVLYDGFSGRPVAEDRASELRRLGILKWCTLEVANCTENETRRFDGTCNNLANPPRGGPLGPYHRLLPPIFGSNYGPRAAKSGAPLPSPRRIRTAVISDGRAPDTRYTQLVTNMGVFLTGEASNVIPDVLNYVFVVRTCCTPQGAADPRCLPVRVPDDDPHLRLTDIRCMNMTRAITYQSIGCLPATLPPERINQVPPMLELSTVYGGTEKEVRRLMEGKGGRLRSEREGGKEWPPTGPNVCVNNRPPAETRCHDGNPAVNSLITANVMYIWFNRNHNRIARELERLNPCWDNERLFRVARDINIAQLQHVVYYEYWPALMGYKFLLENHVIYNVPGHVDDYDPRLMPAVSVEFITGLRWFHLMQAGNYNLYNRTGRLYGQLPVVDQLFRTGVLAVNGTLEGMTQGSFRQPAGRTDYLVDSDIGDRVLGRLQRASDVSAIDLMKGRDAGIQPYNEYRKLCGLPAARTFDDLRHWMEDEQADAFQLTYEHVDDVELMAGLWAERPMPGAAVGPTLACLLSDQLVRWRRADRFFYEHSRQPGALTYDQLCEIRKTTMARLMCDNGDEVDEIQPHAFLLPGHENPFLPCAAHPAPSLEPWRDPRCHSSQNYHYISDLFK